MGAFALQLFQLVPLIIQGVTGAMELFQWGEAKVKEMVDADRDPTESEWSELNAKTNELRTALHSDDV